MTFGREPIEIVEIDIDYCTLTYGTSPCDAVLGATGARKCFNGFATCQSLANYTKGTKTLRFCRNQSGIPKIAGIYPVLQSVSTNPLEINLSGASPDSTSLGKRARVTISLQDFVDDDAYTDKYQAERLSGAAQADTIGYDTSRGSFFSKLMARSPYYTGRALRILRGYVGQELAEMQVENYVVSEWDGPHSSGNVTITAKDIFDLVDGNKAYAPAASLGKLLDDIAFDDETATLTPAGIGDSDYPEIGLAKIGQELVRFTRSGDVLTFTARGVEGSSVSDHSALDVVQICLEYARGRMCDILNDLLTVQGPVSADFFDIDAAQDEEDNWLGGSSFGGIVAEPTSISVLIGELLQHGAYMWWDIAAQEIKFRVNRPVTPGETVKDLSDSANLLEGALNINRADDQRISTVYFWHGVIDPTADVTSGENFAKLSIATDPSASGVNEHNQDRVKAIYSRWFGRFGDDANATVIAERLVARYRDTPTVISGIIDVQSESLAPADVVDVRTYLVQDATGKSAATRFQIRRIEKTGERLKFEAETYTIDGRFGFWMADPQVDWADATDEEKATGAFWLDDADGTFPDGTGAYVYF